MPDPRALSRPNPRGGVVRIPFLLHLGGWPRRLGSAPRRKSQDQPGNSLVCASDGDRPVDLLAIPGRQRMAAQYLRGSPSFSAGLSSAGLSVDLGSGGGSAGDRVAGWLVDRALPTREDVAECPG